MEKLGVRCLAMYSNNDDLKFYRETKDKSFKDYFEYLYIEGSHSRTSKSYKGKLKEEYKNFDGNRIAILCEKSLDIFGGEIQMYEDGEFKARIWID